MEYFSVTKSKMNVNSLLTVGSDPDLVIAKQCEATWSSFGANCSKCRRLLWSTDRHTITGHRQTPSCSLCPAHTISLRNDIHFTT